MLYCMSNLMDTYNLLCYFTTVLDRLQIYSYAHTLIDYIIAGVKSYVGLYGLKPSTGPCHS